MNKKFEDDLLKILTNLNNTLYGFVSDPCVGVQPTMGKKTFDVEISLDEDAMGILKRIAKALEAK